MEIRRKAPQKRRFPWRVILIMGAVLGLSLLVVATRPAWAIWLALVDGLVVGVGLGASGLAKSYDESWDEFWETTVLTYVLGIFALVVFWIRREPPSGFFWVECAAGVVGYMMLLFVPPLMWLGADLMLFFATFVGWFFSGLFRPEYY